MGMRRLVGTIILTLASAAVLSAQPAQAQRVSVLVHLSAGANRGPIRAFAAQTGGQVRFEYGILPDVMNLRGIPSGMLNALGNIPGVQRVEADGIAQAYLGDSTALINADTRLSYDGSGVRVCIVDGGIQANHPMFQDRVADGYDFANDDSYPADDTGHGSHVSGIAAGGPGSFNGQNFHGVAPGATIIPVKVLNNGSGYWSDVIAGIDYCAGTSGELTDRADVINLSLGGGSFSGACDSDSAAAAANNAVDAGVVVVAASGNEGFGNAMGTPACGSKVIAVGATYDKHYTGTYGWCTKINRIGLCVQGCTDSSPDVDDVACFSNQSDQLDVTAPGCFITSAVPSDTYDDYCGTSQASPHVAGLAALLLEANPILTPAEVRQCIRDGAIDMGPGGFDPAYGFGRIDAAASLAVCESITPAPDVTDFAITSVNAPGAAFQGDLVNVEVTVQNVGNQDVSSFNVTLNDDTDGVEIGTQPVSVNLSPGASTLLNFDWSTTTASLGDHTLTADHDLSNDQNTSNDTGSTTVTISEPGAAPPITLSVSSEKIKGTKYAYLSWFGAMSGTVDIKRDGVAVFADQENDGAFTDTTLGKGGGTYTYQVCEAGESTCSDVVSVSF